MADTFSPNLDLTLMARGDRSWDVTLNAILTTLDAQQALGALAVRPAEDGPSASLNVAVSAGTFRKSDGTAVAVAATPALALAASATSSVYLTDAGVVTVSTTGFPVGTSIVPLATVVTGTATVTSITDARRPLTSFGAAVGGTGTVTTVSATVPTGLSVIVNTATTTPAIAITTTLSGLVKGTGSGFAAATAGTDYVTPSGSITGTAANVTGIVAIANGGHGQATASAGFNALSPLTTLGDVLYASAANTAARLAGNTTATKKYLTQTGTGTASAAPAWGPIAAADLPAFVASGSSHAPGAVPDPGATAGATRYLREDATWATPAGSGGGTTGTNGTAVMAANFQITSTSTWFDTGLSIAIPAAGKYALMYDPVIDIKASAGDGWISVRIYDETAAAAVPGSTKQVYYSTSLVNEVTQQSGYTLLATFTGATTVRLEALRGDSGSTTWSISYILSNAGGETTLSYVKLS